MAAATRGVVVGACLLLGVEGSAEVKVAEVFGDGMVLQRGRPIPVWGTAVPGERVLVTFRGYEAQTLADSAGRWRVELPAQPARSEGARLAVVGANTVEFDDVVVGEVWVCAGQSNMEFPLWESQGGTEAVALADLPNLRLFTVTDATAERPAARLRTDGWKRSTPDNAAPFSAVAYHFGRRLHLTLNVPVGLIQADVGGSQIEAWTPREALASDTATRPILDRFDRAVRDYPRALAAWEAAQRQRDARPEYHDDPGDDGERRGYTLNGYDDTDWPTIELPANLERATGDVDGVFWFRRSVTIPPSWAGRPLRVSLGLADDFDVAYFNGRRIGATGPDTPGWWARPRRYDVPPDQVRAGEAVIAVRVFDHYGHGGLPGPRRQMVLEPVGAAEFAQDAPEPAWLPLAGAWRYRVEVSLDPRAVSGRRVAAERPLGPGHHNQPGGLFNAMIHPLIPYAVGGVLWYQGEANVNRAFQYRTLLPMLIREWRSRWGQDALPFVVVQLPGFGARAAQPGDSAWAELREAQALTAQSGNNVGLVVTTELGDVEDIHPTRKREVGERAARWAIGDLYRQRDIVPSGPIFRDVRFDGDLAVVTFETFGSPLSTRDGGPAVGFALAGADQDYHPATEVTLDGETVTLRSPEVARPVAVRYAWEDNPDRATLTDEEGLPAAPFRTDTWRGLTDDAR